MNIIVTIIIGLIVGAVAKLLMPGRDPGGFIVTILLGIAGAMLATLLGRMLGWYAPGRGRPPGGGRAPARPPPGARRARGARQPRAAAPSRRRRAPTTRTPVS